MPATFTPLTNAIQAAFLLGGVILLWRVVLSSEARRRQTSPALPTWEVSVSDFLLFICLVCSGVFVMAGVAGSLVKMWGLTGTEAKILPGAGSQFGLLLAAAVYHFGFGHKLTVPSQRKPGMLVSGLVTFLIARPIIDLVSVIWGLFLEAVGLPLEAQELVDLFTNSDSLVLLGAMIALAVVVAPLAEEFVFRAGIFRYLRTRLPRWAALLLPAVIFAALHGNYASFGPLVALAIVFSLAYERTGRLGTTIVAHALFNLNTLMAIFTRVAKTG